MDSEKKSKADKGKRAGGPPIPLIEPIWEHQPGEPGLWYGRFEKYLEKGLTRSILAVYKDERLEKLPKAQRDSAGRSGIKRVPGSWDENSKRWQWKERAVAFDNYQIEQDRLRWQQQARKNRKTYNDKGQKLIEKATEMLDWALAQVEYASGVDVVSSPHERAQIIAELLQLEVDKETIDLIEQMPIMLVQRTTLKPTRWSMRDAGLLMELGAKLMNLATGQPTAYEQHDLNIGADRRPLSKEDAAHRLFPITSVTVELAQPRPKLTDEDEDEEQPKIH